METKTCSACSEPKPLEDFHRRKASPDGRNCYCKPCAIARATKWQKDNPDKQRARSRAHHESRLERGLVRGDKYRNRYGITVEDYDSMLIAQGGACAICKEPAEGRLHVDHDHGTGEVRGLLCRGCNHGVGNFRDDPKRLRAAITYLEGGQ